MSLTGPCLSPAAPATARRWSSPVVLGAFCGALLLACAPSENQGAAAEEEPATAAPAEEQAGAVEDEADGQAVEPVSVDLPGLPIGGDDVTFTASEPSACVRVNWTAGSLLDGVSVEIRGLAAPEQFVVSSTPCSSTPCLGGPPLTTANPGCEVGVTWNGAPVGDAGSELVVTQARLTCEDEPVCRETLALVGAEGPASIGLFVEADAEGLGGHAEPDTGETDTGGTDTGETDTSETDTSGTDTGGTDTDDGTTTPAEGTG